ncbi:TonB-dependent receptor [Porticoccaceae bacterium LTM1]|nr:TonB-dependent receptor [Porticoccaceae bacterium LTM1]
MIFEKSHIKRNRLAAGLAAAIAVGFSAGLHAKDDQQIQLKIDAKKIGTALMELGESAGVQIMFADGVGSRVSKVGIDGKYNLTAALDVLLKDTGLVYEFTSEASVLVREEDKPEAGSDETVEEVVVTGSRLRKVDPLSATVIITRDELDKLGVSSAEDIVRSLPQNFPSSNNVTNLSEGRVGYFNPQGISSPNLRGLGEDSTLVLVNGRRIAGAALFDGAVVNLNTIPASAIERVEVLLDGASAIYGSDAIGGVINFILKKDYVGATTSVRYENSVNGGDRYRISQDLGFSWDSGRVNATLTKTEDKPISAEKAGIVTQDFTGRGGYDRRGGSVMPLISNTFYAWWTDSYWSVWDEIGTLPLGHDGTNFDESDVSPDNVVNKSTIPFQLGSDSETTSLFLSAEQDITDGISLYADALYDKTETHSNAATYSVQFIVPGTNAFTPYTDRHMAVYYSLDNEIAAGLIDPRQQISEHERVNFNYGVKVNLPFRDWRMDLSGSYAEEKSDSRTLTLLEYSNPELDRLLASSDPSEAINPFGDGSAQSPLLGTLYGELRGTQPENLITGVNLSLDGGIADLPGGEIRMALGAELRREELNFTSSSSDVDLGSEADDLLDSTPSRDLTAYFVEASIPVVGTDNQLPMVKSLTVSLAARWEEYEVTAPFDGFGTESRTTTFSQTSPQIKLSWRPVEDLNIRVSQSTSFRAPTASDMLYYTEEFPFDLAFVDPLDPQGRDEVMASFQYRGNPNLQAETADTYSYGFDWTPAAIEGLSFSMTYSRTEFVDRIDSGFLFTLGDEAVFGNPDKFPGVAERDANGFLTHVNSMPINLAGRLQKSVDFNIKYDFDTDFGSFVTGLAGTYTSTLEDTAFEGLEPEVLNGTERGPEPWKLRAKLDWSYSEYSASLFVNHSSGYTNADTGGPWYAPNPNEKVEGYTTVDVNGRYNLIESGWNLQLGVRNLFNSGFPHASTGYGFDAQRVDTRGRIVYFDISKTFEF